MTTLNEVYSYVNTIKWQSLAGHESWQTHTDYMSNRQRYDGNDPSGRTAALLSAAVITPISLLGLLSSIGHALPARTHSWPLSEMLVGTSISLFALLTAAGLFSSTIDKMGTVSKVIHMERKIENAQLPSRMLLGQKRRFKQLVAMKKSLAQSELSNKFGQFCVSAGATGGLFGICLNVFSSHNPYLTAAGAVALGSVALGVGLVGFHKLTSSSTELKHRQVVELSREFLGRPSLFQRITYAIDQFVFKFFALPILKSLFIPTLGRFIGEPLAEQVPLPIHQFSLR